ncbi:MAG TPA: pilus assembly protein N-terminal domain-containing protein [Rhizomicrobium sp.]|nr:pilus assembly protein N-terminal domain-containing protein [Rhizomicrobium sp.]
MRLRQPLVAAAVLSLALAPAVAKTPVKPVHKSAHGPAHHKVVARHAPALHGVSLTMDEVRVVSFNQPIATVFVGNPTIADATVIDTHHAFVLGKSFGVTNLIALGPQSQTVTNQQITVSNRAGGVVTLNKGSVQFSYACTAAHCESNPIPGDQKAFYDEASSSVLNHQEQAVKAASVAANQH